MIKKGKGRVIFDTAKYDFSENCLIRFPIYQASSYNEKRWEQKGKISERLGVNFFRKLLVWTGWEKLNRKSAPVERNPGFDEFTLSDKEV